MSRPARGLLARTIPSALLALSGTAVAAGVEAPNVDRQLGPYVRSQILVAAERLGQESCAAVLSDYEDPRTGRPLAESLPRRPGGAPAYLAGLVYRLAPDDSPCRSPILGAYTSPGSSVVYVCKRRFDRWKAAGDRTDAANIIIHEALHTLGLGENPPTALEITERVASRCGR